MVRARLPLTAEKARNRPRHGAILDEIFVMYVFATALLNLPCHEIGAAPDPLD